MRAFEHVRRVLTDNFITIERIQKDRKGLSHKKWWREMDTVPSIGLHLAQFASDYEVYLEQLSVAPIRSRTSSFLVHRSFHSYLFIKRPPRKVVGACRC